MKPKSCSVENACYKFSVRKLLFLLVLMSVFLTVSVSAATVQTTDIDGDPKTNFHPQEIVYIVGEGFNPSENIILNITRPSEPPIIDSATVTADEEGIFVYKYALDGINGTYLVETFDAGTGELLASTTFVDDPGVTLLTFRDSGYTNLISVFNQGKTAYGKMIITGGDKNKYYKFQWVNTTDSAVRNSSCTSGSSGLLFDSYAIPPSAPIGTWKLKALQYDKSDCSDSAKIISTINFYVINSSWIIPDDSYVRNGSWYYNENYGNSTELHIKWAGTDTERKRTYLLFDLSEIPDDAVISSAVLHMYRDAGDSSAQSIGAYTVSSFAENTITWNTAPTNFGYVTATNVGNPNGWYNWTLTSTVQSALSSNNLYLAMKFTDESPSKHQDFVSTEGNCSNSYMGPYLEINYTIPVQCSSHPDSTSCNNDPNCVWCPACSGVKWSGGADRCVDKGTPCNFWCAVNQCGAVCNVSSDCANYCDGYNRYYNGVCSGDCACSYSIESCFKDDWYNTTNKQWVSTGECTEKEQVQQEYRSYQCTPNACVYTVTNSKWVDTGNTRYKPDGTACDDGLFCTVDDKCRMGKCSGTPRDCSGNNLAEIATCDNNPDNRPGTFDYRQAFTSVCVEDGGGKGHCTTGDETITHTCADADANDNGPVISPENGVRICTAECDSYGTECRAHLVDDSVYYCYYNGTCNTDPTVCACTYSGEYCPPAGTVKDGVCYYGTRDCNDKEGCTLSTEEMTCHDTCDPTRGPIDTSGPVVSNIATKPNPAASKMNITATATETCAHIHNVTYYIDNQCTGTPTTIYPADDGQFNDDKLVEQVLATDVSVESLNDGTHTLCMKAQNDDGYWGACTCVAFEVDKLPPEMVTKQIPNPHFVDDKGYWICADDAEFRAYFCDPYNQSCIESAEYLVDDWTVPVGQGVAMYAMDGLFDKPCEWANASIDNSLYTEGAHDIRARAHDCACNWGKLVFQTPMYFIIDRTPPVSAKTVREPRVECDSTVLNLLGNNASWESCYFIKTSTLINLSAHDVDKSHDGNYSNAVKIYYRYRWKHNYTDRWEDWSKWFEYTTPFQFSEDSIHELEYYAVDRCGNEETHHFEIDIVDSKPPLVSKIITGPQQDAPDPYHVYISSLSNITLNCTDQQPHPVGGEILHWEMYWKNESNDEWQLIGNGTEQGYKKFTGLSDSYHKFVYWCEDKLGNTGANETEYDIVDNKKPISNKTLGTLKRACTPEEYTMYCGNVDATDCYFINSSTPITINCADQQPHPSGVLGIRYIHYLINGTQPDNYTHVDGTTATFYLTEDSAHLVKWYCLDKVGNMEDEHIECDIVDNKPPLSTKTVGTPNKKVECSTLGQGEYTDGCYYVNSSTQITLNCTDQNPHPVDNVKIYYKIDWKNESSDNWQEGQFTEDSNSVTFTFPQDSYHRLTWYCVDALNNTEQMHTELDIVDNKPPVITKTVGDPKIPGEGFTWITQNTPITLTCTDQNPHPVGNVKIYYRYSVDRELNDEDKWIEYTEPFTFKEDSVHYLEYYCVDELGNRGETYHEIDKVDSTPPTTTKTYGTPFYTSGGREWINSSTPITLTAEDGGQICAVGVNKTYWRNTIVDSGYCSSQEACADAVGSGEWNEYTGPFYKPEESCHLIEYYSVDKLGNVEPTKRQCVYVDNTPPLSTKTVGTPNKKVECSTLGQGEYTDGCYYVNSSTQITLNCTDQNPHPVDNVKIYYKIDWKNESSDNWQEGQFTEDSNSVTFTFPQDSYHRLTWYCVDALGNTEQMHTELDIVDNKPPVITKTVGEPKHACEQREGCDYYITQKTPITLTCVDQQPHPVDNVTIYYKYRVDGGEWTTPVEYNGQEITFTFPQDSKHELEYWCVDELGNTARGSEIDIVDTKPPVTTKTLGNPKVAGEDFTWITQNTPITLTCTDQDPHPVGNVKIYYRYSVDRELNDEDKWIEYTEPFTFKEDSVHYLEYYCVDALGNTELVKSETDKVDTTPPTTYKIITGCHTPCTEDEGCDYWVGPGTKIGFEPVDGGAICAVGVDYTKYRYKYDNGPGKDWDTYNPSNNITFGSGYLDNNGYYYIEYYSHDHLGNTEPVKDEIDIYDNTPPVVTTWNPLVLGWYYNGGYIHILANATDYGNPASGVDKCTYYLVNFTCQNPSSCDLIELGDVPYQDGLCVGDVQVPQENKFDKAFLVVRVTDRSCNEYFGWYSYNGERILLDFDRVPPNVYINHTVGLDGYVTCGDYFEVYLNVNDSMSQLKQCSGYVQDGNYTYEFSGSVLSGRQCKVYGTVYCSMSDGYHELVLKAMDNAYNTGNVSTAMLVDNTNPTKEVIKPEPGRYYGTGGLSIKINMNDTTAGVNESSVQYRIYNSTNPDAICLGNCYNSGWRSTNRTEGNEFVGNYTALHNITAENMSSGIYYMDVRGCDMVGHCVDPLLDIIIDLDPPIGPTNVLIDTAGVITWNAATDALSGMNHYNIYFNGEYVGSTNATTLTYTTNGTAGNYSVSAVDNVGNEGQKVLAQPKPPAPYCGDGTCNGGETCSTCPADCEKCPSGGGGGGGSSGGSSGGSGGGSSGTIPSGGGSSGGSTGGSVGTSGGSTGGNGQVVFTQCSSIGQPCATTADCCVGQCVNYKCAIQEGAGLPTRVDILAPSSALLNDVIVLQLVDEEGKPIADGTVLIISPTRESLVLITDSEGKAGFRATDEGVYTYSAPGHYLVAIRTTNVIKPTETTSLQETPAPKQEQAPPSVAMAVTSLAPWLLGLLVLLLIVIFLATRRRKQKK